MGTRITGKSAIVPEEQASLPRTWLGGDGDLGLDCELEMRGRDLYGARCKRMRSELSTSVTSRA